VAGRAATLVGWGLVALIGALQALRVRAGLLTDYGADLVCPAVLYLAARRRELLFSRALPRPPAPLPTAACILALCYGWELCQRYDLSGTPLFFTRGRFDPFDLLAYTVSIGLCVTLDRFVTWPSQPGAKA
jgi:hypothetical protein